MSRRRKPIQAAGAVVLRDHDGVREVLVVHRPAYDDLTLPKGKQDDDEPLPATAVREVAEETGVEIRLSAALQPVEYQVPRKGGKIVHWWVGVPRSCHPHTPDSEVDEVAWVPVERAREQLSYSTDVQVLDEALELAETSTVILVRHGKAVSRKDWAAKGKGKSKSTSKVHDDRNRPLDPRGRRQARHLVALLAAYGVDRVVTSTSTRCVQTLEPYAQARDLDLECWEDFTEEAHEDDPSRPAAAMRRLVADALDDAGRPVAVCGHRPVLPLMRDAIGGGSHPMPTAECLVVHLDPTGRPVRQEWHSSPL